MSTDRITRVNELLRREVGRALFQALSNERGLDMATVTVTHVETSRNLRTARVGISFRAPEADQQRLLSLVKRHRAAVQEWIGENVILKYTPRLEFELDRSVAKGDHILGVLAEMETEGLLAATEDADPAAGEDEDGEDGSDAAESDADEDFEDEDDTEEGVEDDPEDPDL